VAITAPIVIDCRTNIQDKCTLQVDGGAPLSIGNECTVGHGTIIHGPTVGDHVLIAMNAIMPSYAQVGSHTIIGAGTLVGEHKQISGGVLAMGVPAKVVRELNEEERQRIHSCFERYCELAREHNQATKEA
jgi:carbonic anhydrase/acetyltransferase-like protein (isoleucine patch superfamily)